MFRGTQRRKLIESLGTLEKIANIQVKDEESPLVARIHTHNKERIVEVAPHWKQPDNIDSVELRDDEEGNKAVIHHDNEVGYSRIILDGTTYMISYRP